MSECFFCGRTVPSGDKYCCESRSEGCAELMEKRLKSRLEHPLGHGEDAVRRADVLLKLIDERDKAQAEVARLKKGLKDALEGARKIVAMRWDPQRIVDRLDNLLEEDRIR